MPHVTIEYREEDSFAIDDKLSAACIIGFGLHWAWVYLVMYSGNELFDIGASSYPSAAFIVSLAVFSLTLLCYAVFFPSARKMFLGAKNRSRYRFIAALEMFAGSALLIGASHSNDVGAVICFASGILTGTGSAVLLMSFGISFSVCDLPTASISTALSLLAAACIYVLVTIVYNLIPALGMLLCLAMPFAELWCLKRCSQQLVDNLEFSTCTIPIRSFPFCARVGIPCLLIGVVLGFARCRALAAETRMGGADDYDFPLLVILASIASCTLIVLALLTQRQTPYFIFRTMLPVAAVLFALTATPLGSAPGFDLCSTFACYLLLEASAWITLSDISQHYRISAFSVFGFGRGGMAAGTLAWIVLWEPNMADMAPGPDMAVIIVFMLVLVIFIRSILPTSSELRSTLARCSSCPAFSDEDDIAQANLEYDREMGNGSGRAAQAQPTAAQPQTAARAESPAATSASGTKAQVEIKAGADSGRANDEKTARGPRHDAAPAETGDAMLPGKLGRFKRKCLVTADTYLLSRKETEVLFLLAKGRNSSAIQESLFISPGTANTHMRNIYRKLGVHSQQELISLVESMDDSELA